MPHQADAFARQRGPAAFYAGSAAIHAMSILPYPALQVERHVKTSPLQNPLLQIARYLRADNWPGYRDHIPIALFAAFAPAYRLLLSVPYPVSPKIFPWSWS